MDINLIQTSLKFLSEPSVSEIFKRILRSRISSYYQLEKDENSEQLKNILEKLQDQGLIERKPGSFPDLDKYFPTREGLELEKLIK